MNHVAIMNPKWKLIEKILSGKKTIESRWYKTKRSPWGKIKKGDTVYFKDSGGSIEAKASVYKVQQHILTPRRSEDDFLGSEESQEQNTIIDQNPNEIYQKYGKDIGLNKSEFKKAILDKNNKKYCILLWLKDPRKVIPFNIDKTGFGIASAWITTEDIKMIKSPIS